MQWRYMEKKQWAWVFTYIFKLSKCSDRCFYAKMNIPFKLSILNAASHIDHDMFSRIPLPTYNSSKLDDSHAYTSHTHPYPYYELKIEIVGAVRVNVGSWSAIQCIAHDRINSNNEIDGNDSSSSSSSRNGKRLLTLLLLWLHCCFSNW